MDIVGKWQLLMDKTQKGYLKSELLRITEAAHDELNTCYNEIKIEGKSVSELAASADSDQRIRLIGEIGKSLITVDGSFNNPKFKIKLNDAMPNCIFIALAAIMENSLSLIHI